tara:strand:- start:1238 stop:1942 length:705 start_codon:yes stop_codon:yes gene_type:complete
VFTLYQKDALSFLKELPDEGVDCFITDYPYESLEKHRKKGTTTRLKNSSSSSNDWFSTIPDSDVPELLFQAFRVLKRNRHLYFFCDDPTSNVFTRVFPRVQERMKLSGVRTRLSYHKRIVWNKEKMGMGYHYRAQYEFVLFFEKGKRKLQDLSVPDVLSVPRIKRRGAYPTEKPVQLLETLVSNSCFPGEVVLDPFMGSGSTGVAALRTGCNFIGNDISNTSHSYAKPRLEGYL